jgi:hypothetical protein
VADPKDDDAKIEGNDLRHASDYPFGWPPDDQEQTVIWNGREVSIAEAEKLYEQEQMSGRSMTSSPSSTS